MSYEESGVDQPLPLRPKSAINLPPSPSAAFGGVLNTEAYDRPKPEREIMSDIESSFTFSDTDYSGEHGRNLQKFFGIKQRKNFGPQNLPHRHKKKVDYY